jgi:hypothetical protein
MRVQPGWALTGPLTVGVNGAGPVPVKATQLPLAAMTHMTQLLFEKANPIDLLFDSR